MGFTIGMFMGGATGVVLMTILFMGRLGDERMKQLQNEARIREEVKNQTNNPS